MRAAVGQNGQCYRIGGDEFVIILKNKTAEETEEIIRQVRAEIEFADEQSDIPISSCNGIRLDRCRGKESAGADPLC